MEFGVVLKSADKHFVSACNGLMQCPQDAYLVDALPSLQGGALMVEESRLQQCVCGDELSKCL